MTPHIRTQSLALVAGMLLAHTLLVQLTLAQPQTSPPERSLPKNDEPETRAEPASEIIGTIKGAGVPAGRIGLRHYIGLNGAGLDDLKKEPGQVYYAVRFEVEGKKVLEAKAYVLHGDAEQTYAPIGVSCDDLNGAFFCTTNMLHSKVNIDIGKKGTMSIADAKVTDWTISKPELTLLYKVPAKASSFEMHYGTKRLDKALQLEIEEDPQPEKVTEAIIGKLTQAQYSEGKLNLRTVFDPAGGGTEPITPAKDCKFVEVQFAVKGQPRLQAAAYLLADENGVLYQPKGVTSSTWHSDFFFSPEKTLAKLVALSTEMGKDEKETVVVNESRVTKWNLENQQIIFLYEVASDADKFELHYGETTIALKLDPVTRSKPSSVTPPKQISADQDKEKSAQEKLRLAKLLLDTNKSKAKKRLEDIVKNFDGTEAAREAKELLRQ